MRTSAAVALGLVGCTWVTPTEHAERLSRLDADGDGYIDVALGGDDCDDARAEVNPGAAETCAIRGDEDCDGLADEQDDDTIGLEELWRDEDDDGYGAGEPLLRCPGPGLVSNDGDCDDTRAAFNPGADETCEVEGDEDCDGLVDGEDPDAIGADLLWPDADGDGFGDAEATAERRCTGPGWVADDQDCDDTDALVNPDAPEVCPGYGEDRDCDPTPRPCALEAIAVDPVVQSAGIGEVLASTSGWLVASTADDVRAWRLPRSTRPWAASPGGSVGRVTALPPAVTAAPPVAVLGGALVVGLVDADRLGEVWQVDLATGARIETAGENRTGTLGARVGFVEPAAEDPIPVTLAEKGDNWTLLGDTGGDGSFAASLRLGSGMALALAPSGAAPTVALGDPDAGGGAGQVGVTTGDPWPEGTAAVVRGDAGAGLGRAVLLADLDRDGTLDVVAAETEALVGLRGPFGGQGSPAELFRVPLGAGPVVLATGDVDGDGNPDVVAGLADAGDGAGEVLLLASEPGAVAGAGGEARLRLTGASLGSRLGAAVAVVDIDADGLDDIIIGVPGAGRLLVVPGHADW